MGVRTSISLTVQAGTENSLDNLIFDKSLSELLDTLDKATVVHGNVESTEGNVAIDKQDIEVIRLLYIEADGDLDVFLGGVAATIAQVVAVGAIYPIAPVGGETLDLEIDGVSFTVTFQGTDVTLALVISRINAEAAYNNMDRVASNIGGQLGLTSNVDGSTSQVKIVGGTPSMLTLLGLVAGTESLGKDATPDSDPIRLRQQVAPGSSDVMKSYMLAVLTTSQVTLATLASNPVNFTILMAGDLATPPSC